MKEKPSEWIAISDLMAGVMAVVMLLLVLTVLQKSVSEIRYQEELAQATNSRNGAINAVMDSLSETIKSQNKGELMALDSRTNRLTLRDGVFERGSACLTQEAKETISAVQAQFAQFLKSPKTRILVEGYTDNIPVRQPVVDYRKFCTVYDDNFTLSAARAREARKALVGALDGVAAQRVVVAGYGESRPLPNIPSSDSRNRRVEVQFILDQDK